MNFLLAFLLSEEIYISNGRYIQIFNLKKYRKTFGKCAVLSEKGRIGEIVVNNFKFVYSLFPGVYFNLYFYSCCVFLFSTLPLAFL